MRADRGTSPGDVRRKQMSDEKNKAIEKKTDPVLTPKEADDELSQTDIEKVSGAGTSYVCKTVCGTEWVQSF
jgi:hypothetical protein